MYQTFVIAVVKFDCFTSMSELSRNKPQSPVLINYFHMQLHVKMLNEIIHLLTFVMHTYIHVHCFYLVCFWCSLWHTLVHSFGVTFPVAQNLMCVCVYGKCYWSYWVYVINWVLWMFCHAWVISFCKMTIKMHIAMHTSPLILIVEYFKILTLRGMRWYVSICIC